MSAEEQTAKQAVIASYLRLAEDDLEAARLLKTHRLAPYHLSQAAEKIIKAILTSEGIHGGREHRLDILVDQIPDENPLKPQVRAVEHLGIYATSFRYPSPTGKIKVGPPQEEVEDWADLIESVLRQTAQSFEKDPQVEAPADTSHTTS